MELVTRILCILWACASVGCSVTLKDCKHGGAVRLQGGVRVSKHLVVNCTGLKETDTVEWDMAPGGEQNVTIANCSQCHQAPCPPCALSNNIAGYQVTRNPNTATLKIPIYATNLDGTSLTCRVSNSDGNWSTCSVAKKKTYSVRGCTKGVLELDDKKNEKITCDGLQATEKFKWYIIDNGNDEPVSSCTDCVTCPKQCTEIMSGYSAKRNETHSDLTVNSLSKVVNKIVQCRTFDYGKEAACKIRVVHRGELKNASVELRDSALTGSVSFKNVFASDNNVRCRWNITRNGEVVASTFSTPPELHDKGFSQETPLFYGLCSLDVGLHDLPISEGKHDVTVELFPGKSPLYAGNFTIMSPGPLLLDNATCPEFVTEGDDLRCRCRHLSGERGSPPAKVEWLAHQTEQSGPEIASAEQGVLQIANVRRDMNGKVFTCRSSWPLKDDTSFGNQTYVLNVVYGPDKATVTRSDEDSTSQNVTLACIAHGVNPKAVFAWYNVTCANETQSPSNSTCLVSQDDLNNAAINVTCQASNFLNDSLHATGTYNLLPTKSPAIDADGETPASAGPRGTAKTTIIIIAVAVGLVLLVTIVGVTICACRRNRRLRKRQHQKPKKARNDDQFEMIVNDVYESSDRCLTGGASADNTALPTSRDRKNGEFEMIVNDVYESSDGYFTDGAGADNTARLASRDRKNGEFEMIVNDVYESSDGYFTDGAGAANTARPASRDRRDGDFVEIINDIYESSDGPASLQRPPQPATTTTTTTATTISAPGGEEDEYAVPEKKQQKPGQNGRHKKNRPAEQATRHS